MALVFFNTDIVGTSNAIDSTDISANDTVVIAQNTNIVSTNSFAIAAAGIANTHIVVDGAVYGGSDGVRATFGALPTNNFQITIGDTGSMFGESNAVFAGGANSSDRDNGIIGISNAGDMTSTGGTTLFLFWQESMIINNSGTITKQNFGDGGLYQNAVNLFGVGTATLTNSGTITSLSTGGTSESTAAVNFNEITEVAVLDNTGTISGVNCAVFSEVTISETITNTGMISGRIELSNVDGILSNAGTINGDVSTLGGDDTVTNAGLIIGTVTLGAHNDTYTAFGAGTVTDGVLGGTGEDTITGGSNADFIDGGDDNDRLFGRGGDDDLRGGLGSDFMSAGLGDDQVIGDDGADKIFGSAGDDTLQGGRDRDTIRGGDGEDEINGGRSQDVLHGGDGADVFLYQFRQDSTVNLADTIQDFQLGIDRIDLDALNVAFVGSAAFSGTAQEVRYEIGTDGRTFVEVDTDGTGSADMRINLTTVGALIEDDFIL